MCRRRATAIVGPNYQPKRLTAFLDRRLKSGITLSAQQLVGFVRV